MKKFCIETCKYFTFLALLLLFASCKKDHPSDNTGNTDDYYVNFKVDGSVIGYNKGTEGKINNVDGAGHYQCQIAGLKEQFVADKGTLTIIMTNDDMITTGNTYINYGTSSPGNVRATLNQVGRFDDSGTFFASWDDTWASFGVISDTRVNFTEITDAYIKGNFSATIYKEVDGNSEKHFITEGEFKVKRIN